MHRYWTFIAKKINLNSFEENLIRDPQEKYDQGASDPSQKKFLSGTNGNMPQAKVALTNPTSSQQTRTNLTSSSLRPDGFAAG